MNKRATLSTYRLMQASLAVILMVLVVACNPNSPVVNANGTQVVMFPTRVQIGNLPTSSVGGGGVLPTLTPNPFALPTAVPFVPTQRIATAVPVVPIATTNANWTTIVDGLAWSNMSFRAQSTQQIVSVIVARIDPTKVKFRVFAQRTLQDIRSWQKALPTALLIVNGNFFDTKQMPLGLFAMDGVLYGTSIPRNDVGVFQVVNNVARVRSFWLEPFNNTERFDQLLQGLPMMIVAGQVAPAFNPDLSKAADRRTVIAQDRYGRILIIVTQYSNVTLTDMAKWLGVSGLELQYALNLDGGNSTAMYMATSGPAQFTLGMGGTSIVLGVFRR